ncbi:MAG: hypothetical protein M3008_04680, partial [Chloroflexota bacterium]|nr:hypothetical protein [Chloroflexota bacterium]
MQTSTPFYGCGVSCGVLTAAIDAWGDPTGAVGSVGDDFATVGCDVGGVLVRGVAVGVWAAVSGVGESERPLVAVPAALAGASLGALLRGVPFGVAVAVCPGAWLGAAVPFGVVVTVLVGGGLVGIVGSVI